MTTPSTTAEHRVIYHTVVGRHVRGALRCRPDHLVRRPGGRSPAPRVPRGVVRGVPLGHHRRARAPFPVPPLARTGHGRGGDARGRGGDGALLVPPVIEQTQALVSGLPQTLTDIQTVVARWASQYPVLRQTDLAEPTRGLVASLVDDASSFL